MENRIESLRQNWFVIQQLIKRDKQRSLSSTFMGELWEIINPLINMIVMVLVFGWRVSALCTYGNDTLWIVYFWNYYVSAGINGK